MVIHVGIAKGADVGAGIWDDEEVVWDSTSELWDQTGQESLVRDMQSVTLTRNIGENNSTDRLVARLDNTNGRNASTFSVGDSISLLAEKDVNPPTSKLFAGMVTEINCVGQGTSEMLEVSARDFTSFLQQNTIDPEVYTNQAVEDIVTNLITKYAPSNFTTNNVLATGTTLNRIAFRQNSLFDALKQLADLSNSFFYVDVNRDVHFEPRGNTNSGLIVNNTNVTRANFRELVDEVRNRVYVYGDTTLIKQPQESFTGDGAGSVFTLGYKPHDTKVQVSGAEQVGDIFKGTASVASGVNLLVNFDDKQIVFVSGTDIGYSSIPGSLVQVLVDYNRDKRIVKLAEDPTSQTLYEKRTQVIIDDAIKDPDQARDRAKAELALKKNPVVQGDINLQGLFSVTPGNTITVNLPNQNQTNQLYDILSASYTFNVDTLYSERVLKIRVSRRIGDITDVIKKLIVDIKALQARNIDSTDTITRLLGATGSVGVKVSDWKVKTRSIRASFIVGHSVNGVLGSPQLAVNGSQIIIGDQTSAYAIVASGGD